MPLLPVVNDRLLRAGTIFIAVSMVFVVASGWVPGWYQWVGNERLEFGLFVLSPLDDITHGLTALTFIFAAFKNRPGMSRIICATFGGYYALDAVFFLSYGFVNEKAWYQDIALNMPHVMLGSLLLYLAYGGSSSDSMRAA